MDLITNHLYNLVGGSEYSDYFGYLVCFICGCFIETEMFRPNACPILYSLGGGGKTIFFQRVFFPFGPAFYLIGNVNLTGLGNQEQMLGRQVVIFDESKMETVAAYNKAKDLITNETMICRAMYQPAREEMNPTKYLLLSNKDKPIKKKISPDG